MEKFIVICDKCKSEFDERVPSVDPKVKETARRDCRVHFSGGQIGIDFCKECEKTVTIAEARKIAADRRIPR